MPIMDGKKTMEFLHKYYPESNVLILSMDNSEETILHMIRNGAKGYILKDTNPAEFKKALECVIHKGFYHSDLINTTLLNEVLSPPKVQSEFNERELQFIKLVCSERTYKEIASELYLSPKTIDGYRESLFKRLEVKNRIGLVVYAIKNGIVEI
jgi:DNA-binding NarL/FixJ family response regulator